MEPQRSKPRPRERDSVDSVQADPLLAIQARVFGGPVLRKDEDRDHGIMSDINDFYNRRR